jgi:hypothetical protein
VARSNSARIPIAQIPRWLEDAVDRSSVPAALDRGALCEEAAVMPGQAMIGGEGLRGSTELGADSELLLAEELALLVHGAEDMPWLGAAFGTCLIGALIAELAQRGRLVVHRDAHVAPVIRLIDGSATGDELLDEVLGALSASGPSGARAAFWVFGSLDRWRIRKRGTVERDDLDSWWNGYWSISNVPRVATTLLSQLLVVHESLNTIMNRVNRRLQDRALLVPDAWSWGWAERGDRWRQGFVDEGVRDSIFERWRSNVPSPYRASSSGAGYVLALSVSELVWLKDELADRRVGVADQHQELCAGVSQIVSGRQHRAQC